MSQTSRPVQFRRLSEEGAWPKRKSRKCDPDIGAGRRWYLSALQCYTPEFFYDLCDAPAKWIYRFHVKDPWLQSAARATRAYWDDHKDVVERMHRRRGFDFDLASAEAAILDEVSRQGRKITAGDLMARVSNRLEKLYGFGSVGDFLIPWFVLSVPEASYQSTSAFEFCSPPPEHKQKRKAPEGWRFKAHEYVEWDEALCSGLSAEYEPIDDYKARVSEMFKKALDVYCRRFAPHQYSDWDDALSLYAKWTVLRDSRNWIDKKLAEKRTSENLARWYGCLEDHNKTSASNIRNRVKWFRAHIGLSNAT